MSSDIDCLCGRFIVIYLVEKGDELSVEVRGEGTGCGKGVSCRFRLNEWANAARAVGGFVGGGAYMMVVVSRG